MLKIPPAAIPANIDHIKCGHYPTMSQNPTEIVPLRPTRGVERSLVGSERKAA
jgi:hypothetical protein